jgi:hypothetical protein
VSILAFKGAFSQSKAKPAILSYPYSMGQLVAYHATIVDLIGHGVEVVVRNEDASKVKQFSN